jgi:hypothetical protein
MVNVAVVVVLDAAERLTPVVSFVTLVMVSEPSHVAQLTV